MAHVPHIYVPPPWIGARLDLPPETARHLTRVLRRRDGDPVSYTDGGGVRGTGTIDGDGVVRGDEQREAPPERRLTLAVAPPRTADRVRFLVEKAAELGVARLAWLTTAYGEGRPPPRAKAERWIVGALEQSHSVWLMGLAGSVTWDDLGPDCIIADTGGRPWGLEEPRLGSEPTIAIGPEGGFHPDELARSPNRVSLSDRVLRVETAALAAAVLALSLPDSGRDSSTDSKKRSLPPGLGAARFSGAKRQHQREE